MRRYDNKRLLGQMWVLNATIAQVKIVWRILILFFYETVLSTYVHIFITQELNPPLLFRISQSLSLKRRVDYCLLKVKSAKTVSYKIAKKNTCSRNSLELSLETF